MMEKLILQAEYGQVSINSFPNLTHFIIRQYITGIYLLKPTGGLDVKENQGTLFALKSDKTLGVLTSGVTLSNGLTWNEKLKKFYYIDTMAGEVYQFDYKDTQICKFEKLIIGYPYIL